MVTYLFIINFIDYSIKKICFDNTGEFTSHASHEYCISIGTKVEHPITHAHTQNRLAESLLKCLKLVVRPLLMRVNLPMATWGYAILHAAILIPSSLQVITNTLLCNYVLVSNLIFIIFRCTIYVPISPLKVIMMGSQRRLRIYLGYDFPSIIKYLELFQFLH